MTRRISVALLATGAGIAVVEPVAGMLTMVLAAGGLAISLEEDFLREEREAMRPCPVPAGLMADDPH